ncbi:general substrate transporter [Mycena olivaceomarginata]|nr:general substrate transporter [Mycena olivaceomarginata]
MGLFYNFSVCLFSALGSDSGIIGSVVSKQFDLFQTYFHNPGPSKNGCFAGGCFFGAAAAGSLATRIGRKRTIQLGALVAILGCSLQTGARNVSYLIVGRLIAGLAIGWYVPCPVVPLYQSEISPPEIRGFLTGLTQFMISIGFFGVGYGCQFLRTDAQWRVALGIQIFPAALLFLGMFILPYSPRWLVEKGRNDEAFVIVQRLHGTKDNEEFIALEFAEMKEQIRYEQENYSTQFSDLWSTKPMLRRTLTEWRYRFAPSLPGSMFPLTSNQRVIYAALGLSGSKILMITGINGALGAVVTIIFIYFFLDRVGRKSPLILGSFGMAISLAVEAAINAKWGGVDSTNHPAQTAGVAFIIIFSSLFFSTSFGPVSWVYQSEIFPMRVRAIGTSVCTCANWASNVLISQVSPIGMARLQYRTHAFLLLAAVDENIRKDSTSSSWSRILLNAFIVLFFFPETKGKTLEEMDAVFGDQVIPHALETKRTNNIGVEDEKSRGSDV